MPHDPRRPRHLFLGRARFARPAGLAFLFPGEGSQYPGMLADLCLHFPEVSRRVRHLRTASRSSWASAFRPASTCSVRNRLEMTALWSTATAVNVVLNSQWAMYQVLIATGPASRRRGRPQQRRAAGPGGGGRAPDRSRARAATRPDSARSSGSFESSGEYPRGPVGRGGEEPGIVSKRLAASRRQRCPGRDR